VSRRGLYRTAVLLLTFARPLVAQESEAELFDRFRRFQEQEAQRFNRFVSAQDSAFSSVVPSVIRIR